MHQRDLVREVWGDAGLYRRNDAKLQRFLKLVDDQSTDCWPELAAEARANYPEYIDELVRPIWNSGDELLRLNLLRHAELSNKHNQKLVLGFVKKDLRAGRDDRLLSVAVRIGTKEMIDHIERKRDLSSRLHQQVVRRRRELLVT